MTRVKVSPAILNWVRWRAPNVVSQFPQFERWLKGEGHPTLKQLEKLAKKTNIPLGYFFWDKPPSEMNPIECVAQGVANCFVYEAFKKVEEDVDIPHSNVSSAFQLLGRVKSILGERFEELRRELYEKAQAKFFATGFDEADLTHTVDVGLRIGEWRPLPAKTEIYAIHYGFIADIVVREIGMKIRYVSGTGWEVWKGRSWQRRPKERGIVGLIYEVMQQKIAIWREALKTGAGGRELEEWIEKLVRKINNPRWLKRVEELLLTVDYFGVLVVFED
jgi:hypothetical protein